MIELNGVSWRRGERLILRDIHWRIEPGQHWCLFGLNGSGKTTLLNIINGYIWPTQGEVTVLGKRFGQVDVRELRKWIGLVSLSLQQKFYGYEPVEEIVMSGKFASIGLYDVPSDEDRQRADDLLVRMGCAALRGRSYQTLSQGEQQRVLIARALMASPKLLILDEPCSGLDVLAREQLLQMIGQLADEPDAPTLLYVTHHLEEILPCFSHTLLLKEGSVYRAGATTEILTSDCLSGFLGVPVDVREWNGRYFSMILET
ncbi:ABC transporter ATP-binding protein [Brevibacillus sp. SYP-B805]|uniref:ABC transporter ATP-binding protein n=1 Tax=Brevibacillus sp. SYP-B805 TaxID=1578199 RepID=UPI0013EA6B66|nr:ABC transporter ATP-binding protein [Brevibacillus sp. SYP-B805]NGQ97352.1 ABC transporter ATP-binding protein [Brevibacillus sp. SYP-B805]